MQTLIKKKKRSTNPLMNAKQNLNQDSMKRKITLGANNSKMITILKMIMKHQKRKPSQKHIKL